MNRALLIILSASAAVTSGCRDEEAHSKIERLEATVQSLQTTTQTNWTTLRDSQVRLAQFVFDESNQKKSAVLDPSSKEYSFLESDAGRLLVSCESAEPFLDGHKLVLRIGNPLSMSFKGFKLKFRYGSRAPKFPKSPDAEQLTKWQQANAAWQLTLHEKELSFTDTLSPAAWNRIEAVITPSKPDELAHLEIKIETDTVSLYKQK